MQFDIKHAIEILERTPDSFQALLISLSKEWTSTNEGNDTWNVMDVVAHLIYLDRANWLHRARLLLTSGEMVQFDLLNREGGKALSTTLSADELLNTFCQTRKCVLKKIWELQIGESHYDKAIPGRSRALELFLTDTQLSCL